MLVSEISGRPEPVHLAEGFHAQLAAWFDHWAQLAPEPDQLWVVPPAATGGCTWADAGRALGLTRIRAGREELSDLRRPLDQIPSEEVAAHWRLIVSLNRFFSNVDPRSEGAITIDDQWGIDPPEKKTGPGPWTTFRQQNPLQVRCLQAILSVLRNNDDIQISGDYDTATKTAHRELLGELELDGDATETWQGLLEVFERAS